MYYYKIYGLAVESDLEIPEAYIMKKTEKIDVTIKKDISQSKDVNELSPFEKKVMEDYGGYRTYHQDKEARLWLSKIGYFSMKYGTDIRYWLIPGTDQEHVRQIMLTHCLNIIMMQRSIVSLHGSGLLNGDSGLIISGKSGAGKTTLSTALLKLGLAYVADDVNATYFEDESVMMQPAYPQRKLCGDTLLDFGYDKSQFSIIPSYEKSKYSYLVEDNFITEAIALNKFVIIEPEDVEEVTVRQITGSEKAKYIVNNVFAKEDYDKVGFGMAELQKCFKIAGGVEIFILNRPKIGNTVDEQIQVLLNSGIIDKRFVK